VQRVANRVAVLSTRLVALDTPAALRARVFGPRVLVTLGQPAARFADTLREAFNDVRVSDHALSIGVDAVAVRAPAIVRTLVHGGADVVSVTAEEPPLEDVYLRLLEKETTS